MSAAAVKRGRGGNPNRSASIRLGYDVKDTDLYDTQRKRFLVRYPAPLVVGLALSGVVAFALTGFLGYNDGIEWPVTTALFSQAWPLFLWFCALIMALQASILRHRKLRSELVATLTVTLISMLIVGIVYYYKTDFLSLLQSLLEKIDIRVIFENFSNKWLFALINFGILAIYWLDTIRRWIQSARGQRVQTTIGIGFGGVSPEGDEGEDDDQPTLQELISGDLIAGAVLVFILSLIFRVDIINFLQQALTINVPVTGCTVSWPFGICVDPGGGIANPPTLSFIDLIQTLIYLPIGLLILALTALLAGLDADSPERQAVERQRREREAAGLAGGGEGALWAIIQALSAALNRRIRFAADNAARSLRTVVWPLLILVGVIAAAAAARDLRLYLHLLSDQHVCPDACAAALASYGWIYQYVLLALVWGLVAVVCIVLSVAILVVNWRVIDNTARFLGLIGFIFLLTLWIFSLSLSGFNLFLLETHLTYQLPFPQPGISTAVSFAVLIIWAGVYFIRQARTKPQSQPVVAGSRASGTPRPPSS